MRITERARIESVQDGRATVTVVRPEDRAACERCAHSLCVDSGRARPRHFAVLCPPGARAGQCATVELEIASPAWAAFLLFILPMGCAFAVGGAAYHLTGSGSLGLVGGVAAALVAYAVVHIARASGRVDGRVTALED